MTTTATILHIMRVGRGIKLHIQAGTGGPYTLCGTGNTYNLNTFMVRPTARIDRQHGTFSTHADAAAWLIANAPRNACTGCVKHWQVSA